MKQDERGLRKTRQYKPDQDLYWLVLELYLVFVSGPPLMVETDLLERLARATEDFESLDLKFEDVAGGVHVLVDDLDMLRVLAWGVSRTNFLGTTLTTANYLQRYVDVVNNYQHERMTSVQLHEALNRLLPVFRAQFRIGIDFNRALDDEAGTPGEPKLFLVPLKEEPVGRVLELTLYPLKNDIESHAQ